VARENSALYIFNSFLSRMVDVFDYKINCSSGKIRFKLKVCTIGQVFAFKLSLLTSF
jgi:hypothetical protein